MERATQQALRAFYSGLVLEGVPAGARVSIDGAVVGETPLSEPLLADLGRRQLRVELDGYEPFRQPLEVPGGTTLALPVVLVAKKLTATLSVATSERAAVIVLDGKVVGSDHWQGSLPAGTHRLRVTARDKKPYEIALVLASGSQRSLQIALQDSTRAQPLWPWLAGGAAAVLGASIGGYFLFKPSDTRGAPPPGELGNVQLPLGERNR